MGAHEGPDADYASSERRPRGGLCPRPGHLRNTKQYMSYARILTEFGPKFLPVRTPSSQSSGGPVGRPRPRPGRTHGGANSAPGLGSFPASPSPRRLGLTPLEGPPPGGRPPRTLWGSPRHRPRSRRFPHPHSRLSTSPCPASSTGVLHIGRGGLKRQGSPRRPRARGGPAARAPTGRPHTPWAGAPTTPRNSGTGRRPGSARRHRNRAWEGSGAAGAGLTWAAGEEQVCRHRPPAVSAPAQGRGALGRGTRSLREACAGTESALCRRRGPG